MKTKYKIYFTYKLTILINIYIYINMLTSNSN